MIYYFLIGFFFCACAFVLLSLFISSASTSPTLSTESSSPKDDLLPTSQEYLSWLASLEQNGLAPMGDNTTTTLAVKNASLPARSVGEDYNRLRLSITPDPSSLGKLQYQIGWTIPEMRLSQHHRGYILSADQDGLTNHTWSYNAEPDWSICSIVYFKAVILNQEDGKVLATSNIVGIRKYVKQGETYLKVFYDEAKLPVSSFATTLLAG